MTDIQRHLKPILKHLKKVVHKPDFSQAALQVQLRELLPYSYGIGQGSLFNQAGTFSQPLPLILYDRPLAQDSYDASSDHFLIDHGLLVLDVLPSADWAGLKTALDRAASFKALKSPADEAINTATHSKIPKYRLPVSLIYIENFVAGALSEAAFHRKLYQMIQQVPIEQQPDFIYLVQSQLLFQNPLLSNPAPSDFEIGLTRFPQLIYPRDCYVCKERYWHQHFFYEKLCPTCGDFNYHKRQQTADLSGQIALITGARVKIGYAVALHLLRCGATVIATTRFPHDAARRYAQEADFDCWRDRLHVIGLDLRYTPAIETFTAYLYQTYPHLDILINNAAQTVYRPPAYYAHLLPFERQPFAALAPDLQAVLLPPSASGQRDRALIHTRLAIEEMIPVESDADFPAGQLDQDQQQIDNRPYNSWVMPLEDVPMAELVEVHLINAVAPALLAGQLKALMERSPAAQRHIINVSSVEGQFAQKKRAAHIHTNMAKAALNMLTRSIADTYAEDRIFVNSVDPGWVSDQFPRTGEAERAAFATELPLDLIDAAARICDPIFSGIKMAVPSGQFLKDYTIAAW